MTGPQRFRKKPVEIEAVQWDGDVATAHPIIQWVNSTAEYTAVWREELRPRVPLVSVGRVVVHNPGGIFIRTLEGEMHVSAGDWIIRGIQGEFYPCKPDIFAATYEPVGGPL